MTPRVFVWQPLPNLTNEIDLDLVAEVRSRVSPDGWLDIEATLIGGGAIMLQGEPARGFVAAWRARRSQ